MKPPKFLLFLVVLLAIAAAWYFFSTDRTSDTVLIGIVDANQVIVSSKIMGRVEKLYVDEGSKVKAGDLIAEIDSAELEAQKNAAQATINAYDSQVSSMKATEAETLGETNSGGERPGTAVGGTGGADPGTGRPGTRAQRFAAHDGAGQGWCGLRAGQRSRGRAA